MVFVVKKLEVGQNPIIKPYLLRFPEHKIKKLKKASVLKPGFLVNRKREQESVNCDVVITSLVY